MSAKTLQPSFGETIPSVLEKGVLYISMEYATAVHLCACGCESKVVTPIGPADWQLLFDGTVTIRPSIGNGQFRCHSHYFIRQNAITWVRPISPEVTRVASRRDRAELRAVGANHTSKPSRWHRLCQAIRKRIGQL